MHCIKFIREPTSQTAILATGASDQTVKLLNPDTFDVLKSFSTESIPRSLDVSKFLLVGLKSGTIYEYDINVNAKEAIMHSHHSGEVWGLTAIDSSNCFLTSGDDNKILMFDLAAKKMI